MNQSRVAAIPIGTGLENTAIKEAYPTAPGTIPPDAFGLMRHLDRFESDLARFKDSGATTLRYPIPWHRIEHEQGAYDWVWLDQVMATVQRLGIDLIADPLHHTSFPNWLTEGFADDRFEEGYVAFVHAFVARYPWVRRYAVMNEPYVTLFFCGHEGIWYPFHRGDERFVKMVISAGRAIARISRFLVDAIPGVEIIHVDTCERHEAAAASLQGEADRRNQMRFLVLDLILGRIDPTHPLRSYLGAFATVETLDWFVANPSPVHVLGLDYYTHSELFWTDENGFFERVLPPPQPQGFAELAMEYFERYRLPIRLTETNLRGTVTDRVVWLKYILRECSKLQAALPSGGFVAADWFPFLDCTGWNHLVTKASGDIDPQGIWWIDSEFERRSSPLSEIFGSLARGEMTWKEIPDYQFDPPMACEHPMTRRSEVLKPA